VAAISVPNNIPPRIARASRMPPPWVKLAPNPMQLVPPATGRARPGDAVATAAMKIKTRAWFFGLRIAPTPSGAHSNGRFERAPAPLMPYAEAQRILVFLTRVKQGSRHPSQVRQSITH
jgi:hypothetical protein